jgi:hypothetical protein
MEILDKSVIEMRKKLIYEVLENVPAKKYVTITSIKEYLAYSGIVMDQISLLSFITIYCSDIYEGEGPGFYYYGLTDAHVFADEPDDEKLLALQSFYRANKSHSNKRKVAV